MQAADTGIEPSSGESTQNTTDLESSPNTTSVNEKYDPEKTMLQVKENHVTASLPGKSGTLTIEADITGNTDDVSKGVLKKMQYIRERHLLLVWRERWMGKICNR